MQPKQNERKKMPEKKKLIKIQLRTLFLFLCRGRERNFFARARGHNLLRSSFVNWIARNRARAEKTVKRYELLILSSQLRFHFFFFFYFFLWLCVDLLLVVCECVWMNERHKKCNKTAQNQHQRKTNFSISMRFRRTIFRACQFL